MGETAMEQITPAALKAWLDDGARPKPVLLDVREPWETAICALPSSLQVPMNAIPARIGELDAAAETVVICHHGGRSAHVAMFLERNGFARVHNLAGGVDAWARSVDPSMARY
jgi:rhodanese-related sulfurtransferase